MNRTVVSPPENGLLADGTRLGGWWHDSGDGRIVCDLCPRDCHLKPGDRGFCFVRQNLDGEMRLTTYGRSTGFCIDPIEKKPLNHFYPGTSVLSFGTAGCNLGCKFCQNWDISKSREVDKLSAVAAPEAIARAAQEHACHSVAFTYNDPVIWAEYAIDTAKVCRAVGIQTVAVTAAYISKGARQAFYEDIDAANVDLKSFSEEFYHKVTYSHLQPVLETIEWLKTDTDVWLELTNLVIPQENDSIDEFREMCDWVLESVGDGVPIHFTAFHPDFRMTDRPPTPAETLLAARDVALRQGVKFAYVGNVNDIQNQSTYCPTCGQLLIERNWYELGQYQLSENCCGHCGETIPGRFGSRPGTWGRQRLPVKISDYRLPQPLVRETSRETKMTISSSSEGPPTLNLKKPTLTEAQDTQIHKAACQIISNVTQGRSEDGNVDRLTEIGDEMVMGAFTTLKLQGSLRSCCGCLGQPMKIRDALAVAAKRTAREDPRFPPISSTELPHLDLEVTLLFGFHPIGETGERRVTAVEVGKHGLQLRRGNSSGLLLPGVAVEYGGDAETFLAQVCRKAQLPVTAWRETETEILTFEGHVISGALGKHLEGQEEKPIGTRFVKDELLRLSQFCRDNIVALIRGATPSYYLPDAPEGNISGLGMQVKLAAGEGGVTFSQLSIRNGMPLQATLYRLVEAAVTWLRSRPTVSDDLAELEVGVTVLSDPALHGNAALCDVSDLDTATRALLIVDNTKSVWEFDPSKTSVEILADLQGRSPWVVPEGASVFSLAASSSADRMFVSRIPRPIKGPEVRPAAVAGAFYPADKESLEPLLTKMIGEQTETQRRWPGIMVPHAGWRFSGKLTADVLKLVHIPKTVIVLGPKHTRDGVDWAVAPHDAWEFPTGRLQSDVNLACLLAQEIRGLELDAAAHQTEHAIEVLLPILHRLAPSSKVVGIAIGAGSLKRCREFAEGLARVIRTLDSEPLLIISSDMNHFATEAENRRLDEIAITALETLSAEKLHKTVTGNGISMCGVLPAVIVLETLATLNQLHVSERVGYATSADVTQDSSRVVGYAGMLFGGTSQ